MQSNADVKLNDAGPDAKPPTEPYISDSVNRDISTAMGRASLYDWIVYKRESKARERKGEEDQRRLK